MLDTNVSVVIVILVNMNKKPCKCPEEDMDEITCDCCDHIIYYCIECGATKCNK